MRLLIVFLLNFFLLGVYAQPFSYSNLGTQQLIDSGESRLDVSNYSQVNEIIEAIGSRLDSTSDVQLWYGYYKLNGRYLFDKRNIPAAQKEFGKALKLSEKHNDSLKIGIFNSELANTFSLQGAYREALKFYDKALSFFPEKSKIYTSTLMNMSMAYKGLNQYDKALSVLAKGRPFYESLGDYKSIGILENNIGEIYRTNIGDLEQAKAHYHRAIKANLKANSESGIAQNYHNLATLFLDLENTDSALYYANSSMQIKTALGDEGGIASSHFILGDVYFQRGDYNKARSSFEKSLNLSTKYQLMEGIYYNNLRLGQIHKRLANYIQGEIYLLKARDIAQESEDLNIIEESYNQLYQLYKEKGDFKNALAFNEKLQEISDSISDLKATQRLDELRTQYESDMAKSENLVLREKEKVQEANIANQRKLLYLSLASLVLLVLAAIWLINMLRQRNGALSNVKESKAKLENQNQKLKESEERLQKTNDLKNKILSVLGHDLRNPLNNISTLLGAVSSTELKQEEFTDVLGYLQKETEVSQIILQEILAWARLQMDEEGKILESVEASKLIDEIINIHNHTANEKGISFKTNNVKAEFCADRNQMRSIFSNLIFNAIKFSGKGKEVLITTDERNDEIIFSITDSGKGIDPKVLENLNKRHKVISENGTSGERGTGIGLRIVSDFVEAHGGTLSFKNNTNGGATVSVSIPKKPVKDLPKQVAEPQH